MILALLSLAALAIIAGFVRELRAVDRSLKELPTLPRDEAVSGLGNALAVAACVGIWVGFFVGAMS